MASVRVVVASPVGLHARPAAVFVQAVIDSGLPILLSKSDAAGSAPVDARSILAVLALDVAHGDEVELIADGEDAGDVLSSLAALLSHSDAAS
ncbi:MAG TPA: HPr family phosphocarrier protein [Acidothermaceae bacterium]|nr:HPr family phosphocarrier protein [Acidothermaceae bacterium]